MINNYSLPHFCIHFNLTVSLAVSKISKYRRFAAILPFLVCACLPGNAQQGTWHYFPPAWDVKCIAASGNDILLGTEGGGLVRLDTLENPEFFSTSNSGIPSDSILQAAVDADGNWWLYYPGGITRYNGANWQSWSVAETGLPAGTAITVIKPAPGGAVYFGSANGAAIYQNNAWSVLNTSNSGLPHNNVRDVAFGPAGEILFATNAGLAIQNGAGWTVYNAANTGISYMSAVRSVTITSSGVIWATTTNVAQAPFMAVFENGAWSATQLSAIGLQGVLAAGRLITDAQDRVWLTHGEGVSVLTNTTWTHYLDMSCNVSAFTAPLHIAIDGADQVWTTACNLTKFDGQNWRKLGVGFPGMTGNPVQGIAQGADGSMWFGTDEGLTRLINDTWTQSSPVDLGAASADVTSIQTDPQGQTWFGLGNGEILRYTGGNWTLFDTCFLYFTDDYYIYNSATAPNGDQWFSIAPAINGSARLARYSNGNWDFFTPDNSPLPDNSTIEKIAFAADGTVWLASQFTGLYSFDGANWTHYTADNSGLPADFCYDLAFAPDGVLWVCVNGSGLAAFDGANWSVINTDNSDLPSNSTNNIAFDHAGGMYVGYFTGPGVDSKVAVWRNNTWTELAPPNLGPEDDGPPFRFVIDSENRLWYSQYTREGVYRYDPMIVSTQAPVSPTLLLTAFPNPSEGLLTINLPDAPAGLVQLRLCNIHGQVVFTSPLLEQTDFPYQVDWRHLPAGVYGLTAVQGGDVFTIKWIKR